MSKFDTTPRFSPKEEHLSRDLRVSGNIWKKTKKQGEKVGNYGCLWASSVVCNLPPRFLHCRSYDRGSEPSCLSGLGLAPRTGKRCPAPNWSTKNVHSCLDWCHSSGRCLNNVHKPAGKLLGPPQDWVSGPFGQPPESTVLQQKSEPSAGCLLHPTAPSAEERAWRLRRQDHKVHVLFIFCVYKALKFTKILSAIWALTPPGNLNLPFNQIHPSCLLNMNRFHHHHFKNKVKLKMFFDTRCCTSLRFICGNTKLWLQLGW